MSQADSLNTTGASGFSRRQHLGNTLSGAVAASLAGGTAVSAAAIAQAVTADPIFAAIEAHAKAQAAFKAHEQRYDEAAEAAKAAGYGHSVYVRGADGEWHEAAGISQINSLVEDKVLRQYCAARFRERGNARSDFMANRLGCNEGDIFGDLGTAAYEALLAFAECVPVTLQGLTAKLLHVGKIVDEPGIELSDDTDMVGMLLWSLGESASSLAGAQHEQA